MLHCRARPGAKPLEPFGKGSNALKAGTPDAGPVSPTVQEEEAARPSVQPPAGVERKPALYAGWPERQASPRRPQRALLAGVLAAFRLNRDCLDITAMAVFFAPALQASLSLRGK
jgi:hypothetical protein